MCDHGWSHKAQWTQDVSNLCAGIVRFVKRIRWQHLEISNHETEIINIYMMQVINKKGGCKKTPLKENRLDREV